MEELLLVVHPGYLLSTEDKLEDIYGNHDDYLERLKKEMWTRRNCIIVPYKDNELPFDVPRETEVIRDGGKYEELIERLEMRGTTNIALGGIYLWWYARVFNPKKLSEWGRSSFEMFTDMLGKRSSPDSERSKKEDVDIKSAQDIFDSFYDGIEVEDGCVIDVKNKLEGFSVRVIRELCYPVKEPELERGKIYKTGELANLHDPEFYTNLAR